jgi:GTPase SAR1 family protein
MSDATRRAIVNPFPGPQPYRASDRARFYGREAVGHELASMILAHRCVALFGPSGAGKSSVMQAAVIPELDEDYDFRHVAIDGWPADEEPVAWLLYTLHAQLKLAPPDGRRSASTSRSSGRCARRFAARTGRS